MIQSVEIPQDEKGKRNFTWNTFVVFHPVYHTLTDGNRSTTAQGRVVKKLKCYRHEA